MRKRIGSRLGSVVTVLLLVHVTNGQIANAQDFLGPIFETTAGLAVEAAKFIAKEAASYAVQKAIIEPVADRLTGRDQKAVSRLTSVPAAELDSLRHQIETLSQGDKENSAELRRLSYRLQGTMTRDEVHALLMGSLTRIDVRLARMTARIEEQQDLLVQQARKVSKHEERMNSIDKELVEFAKMYPRMSRTEQGGQLAGEAFKAMSRGDYQGAVRSFRFAHAADPTAAEHLYGQALAHHLAGELPAAKDSVARAIFAERYRPLPRWFPRALEGIQGPHREFMESSRRDPFYGVLTPGTIRAPILAN